MTPRMVAPGWLLGTFGERSTHTLVNLTNVASIDYGPGHGTAILFVYCGDEDRSVTVTFLNESFEDVLAAIEKGVEP